MGIEKKLVRIKQIISTAERKHHEEVGRRTELLEQLKGKHDCTSTTANRLYKKNKKRLSKLLNSLETDVEKVQDLL